MLIDGKCGNLKILIDGGKLTRNINQKKKLDVLQGLHSVTNTAGESISSISNWLWNGMKMLWYSVFSFLLFWLDPTVRKDIQMRTTSAIVMVIFQKCHSENYLIYSYIQSLLSTITSNTDSSILKDTWQFYDFTDMDQHTC